MEEKKQSLGITTLGYAAAIGAVVIIFSLLLFVMDVNKQSWINYFSYVFLVAGLVMAQLNYRNRHLGGFMSYGKSFMVGFITVIYYSIIMAVFSYIFFTYIDPGFIEEMRQLSEQKFMDRGMSDQEIDQAMKIAEKFQTPGMMVFWALVGGVFIGTVLSLVAAIFTKKDNPNEMPVA